MSSSNSSTNGHTNNHSTIQEGGCWNKSGNWSGFNIAAMVLGFVFFWPLGLFILYWIISGRNVKALPQAAREQWSRMKGKRRGSHTTVGSDNILFNDYQEAQYDRIREIKEEIKERTNRFHEYRANARRRADEEEFNRFMSDAPGSQ